jgi:RHS repeat-associated protein
VIETYTCDKADRITGIAYSTGGSVTYTYNAAGRLTSRVNASGTTTMTYDPLGRLASRKHSSNNLQINYTYDKAGNLATVVDPGGTTTYAYDARNLVTRMTLPAGQLIDFGYDADGRRIDTWQGTNTAHTTWDAHTRTTYDAADRVSRVFTARASNDNTRVSDLTYSYASNGGTCSPGKPSGTDTSLRQTMTDHTTGQVTTYCYTTSNRLASATTTGGDAFTYNYDVDGNRTQMTKNGVTVDTQTTNAADQLTNTGYSHDASGNLTASPALGAVTYSPTEQMTQRVDGSVTSTYSYAGTNQTELLSVNPSNSYVRSYTYGRDGADGTPLIESYYLAGDGESYIAHDPNGTPIAIRASTGQIHYYAEDGLGSTIALVNQDGAQTADYAYDPSGEVTVTNPTSGSNAQRVNPFRYAGGTYDVSSNLIKFGQRWYDPDTGRFTQQDSLETLADPTRANRYEYANGNPINYVDPTGRYSLDDFVGTLGNYTKVGAAIGGTVGLVLGGGTPATIGTVGAGVLIGGAIGGAAGLAVATGEAIGNAL